MFIKPVELQKETYQRIYDSPFVEQKEGYPFLSSLIGSDTELLGEVGVELKKYAEVADLHHPAAKEAVPTAVGDGLSEFLALGQIAAERNYAIALSQFPRIIRKIAGGKYVNLGRQYCRTLKSADERRAIRLQKQIRPVDLTVACAKGEPLWYALPDNFAMYIRNSKDYEEILVQVRLKAERYKRLGCESLYQEIKKSIDEFEAGFCQNYYGFHRVKMTDAAIILAKMHGFSFERGQILIEKSKIGSTITSSTVEEKCVYEPIICPVVWLNTSLPEPILNVINFLEVFPEAGGKPIFDHYVCVHPNTKGRKAFPIQIEEDIENGIFLPILLGEKDGKCYFICHWF